jgi:hypothetical protein
MLTWSHAPGSNAISAFGRREHYFFLVVFFAAFLAGFFAFLAAMALLPPFLKPTL